MWEGRLWPKQHNITLKKVSKVSHVLRVVVYCGRNNVSAAQRGGGGGGGVGGGDHDSAGKREKGEGMKRPY